ncbi:MAG: hypothetical protein LV481_14170 [Methylacidiphilales bacterium]|nr:hypothetical protein [Candidatus Methylacidiphilales bacterium]
MKPISELRHKLGIDTPLPQTHLAWMLDLVRKHGEPGLRYAVGLKTNHILYIDPTYSTEFRVLVAEVLSWKNSASASMLDLLKGENAWAARYVADQESGLAVNGRLPDLLPPPPLEVNYQLAGDFAGEGMPYALRYFTAPTYPGALPLYQQATFGCRQLLERIVLRRDWLSKRLIEFLALPEFSCIAHLLPREDSDGKGGAVLDITVS